MQSKPTNDLQTDPKIDQPALTVPGISATPPAPPPLTESFAQKVKVKLMVNSGTETTTTTKEGKKAANENSKSDTMPSKHKDRSSNSEKLCINSAFSDQPAEDLKSEATSTCSEVDSPAEVESSNEEVDESSSSTLKFDLSQESTSVASPMAVDPSRSNAVSSPSDPTSTPTAPGAEEGRDDHREVPSQSGRGRGT